ncbi:hypothetical protein HK099_000788 [Clydaea vesicula]|uniref:Uncharacterized protein n=1 Tax=Clydaea vesicula TaxID=447962 RepID=A0AAD5U7L9_9FUNG|nr:hypothetical protein HK099_000788 [Clydaea vesicula]
MIQGLKSKCSRCACLERSKKRSGVITSLSYKNNGEKFKRCDQCSSSNEVGSFKRSPKVGSIMILFGGLDLYLFIIHPFTLNILIIFYLFIILRRTMPRNASLEKTESYVLILPAAGKKHPIWMKMITIGSVKRNVLENTELHWKKLNGASCFSSKKPVFSRPLTSTERKVVLQKFKKQDTGRNKGKGRRVMMKIELMSLLGLRLKLLLKMPCYQRQTMRLRMLGEPSLRQTTNSSILAEKVAEIQREGGKAKYEDVTVYLTDLANFVKISSTGPKTDSLWDPNLQKLLIKKAL